MRLRKCNTSPQNHSLCRIGPTTSCRFHIETSGWRPRYLSGRGTRSEALSFTSLLRTDLVVSMLWRRMAVGRKVFMYRVVVQLYSTMSHFFYLTWISAHGARGVVVKAPEEIKDQGATGSSPGAGQVSKLLASFGIHIASGHPAIMGTWWNGERIVWLV